jgi:hypothetical protein
MGIAFFTFGGMFGPLHSLVGWLGGRPRPVPGVPAPRAGSAAALPARACAAPRPAPSARHCEKARRPLRVVRVLEGGGAPASAGRMFMSGRMADVCAELDRLAALEAAAP